MKKRKIRTADGGALVISAAAFAVSLEQETWGAIELPSRRTRQSILRPDKDGQSSLRPQSGCQIVPEIDCCSWLAGGHRRFYWIRGGSIPGRTARAPHRQPTPHFLSPPTTFCSFPAGIARLKAGFNSAESSTIGALPKNTPFLSRNQPHSLRCRKAIGRSPGWDDAVVPGKDIQRIWDEALAAFDS